MVSYRYVAFFHSCDLISYISPPTKYPNQPIHRPPKRIKILLQERIMQEPFGGERFTYSLLLVLCNRLVTVAVASSLLIASGQDIRPVAPPQAYAAVSVSNVVATFCQYEALRHVSFPLQTLGKCAKMIPVMVWGTFIMRKRYSTYHIIFIIILIVFIIIKHHADLDSYFLTPSSIQMSKITPLLPSSPLAAPSFSPQGKYHRSTLVQTRLLLA